MSRYRLSFFLLRLSLGVVFLWIGLDMIRHPNTWIGFIPASLPLGLSQSLALRLSSFMDIVLGALIILGPFRKITSALASLHLISIIIIHGLDAVLIRDVGLLGASLALFFWPGDKHHRKGFLKKLL